MGNSFHGPAWIEQPLYSIPQLTTTVPATPGKPGFVTTWNGGTMVLKGSGFMIPDWLLVLGGAVFAVAPWLRWRFSLRTLLITTTLIAVLLGFAVYAARK